MNISKKIYGVGEEATLEQVLKRSRAIREPNRDVPSLHYLLVMKGNQGPLMRPKVGGYNQMEANYG